ncbi:unannotated protein [freshwater metagenome]|uniref:Unannotated protein n=1 Tax=freshwater metagenome TaxID=449393 RepID=A0A6J7K9M6_9ZZZZ
MTRVTEPVRTPAGLTLLALVAVGFVIRVGAMMAVRPIAYGLYDSGTYLAGAVGDKPGGVFADTHHAVGYSVFLRFVGWFTDSGSVLAMVQHGLGLVSGVLIWTALRRLGANIAVAAIGAIAVLWNFELVQLEHSILSEALYVPALAAGFSAAVWAATTRARAAVPLAMLAGLSAAVAYSARYPGILWIAAVIVIAVFAGQRSGLKARALRGAAVGIASLVLLLSYVGAQGGALNMGLDFFPGEGWNAYAGIAAAADCKRFTPPPGTRKLCDKTPVSKRPTAPEFYTWNGASPAFKLEPRGFPYSDALFAKFAAAASASVTARGAVDAAPSGGPFARYTQPVVRYLGPSGALASFLAVNRSQEAYERGASQAVFQLAPISYGSPGTGFEDMKQVVRISGGMLLILIAVSALALIRARRFRLEMLACWAFVYINWVVAGTYNPRYAVPLAVVGVLAGCFALMGLLDRSPQRESHHRNVAEAGDRSGGW